MTSLQNRLARQEALAEERQAVYNTRRAEFFLLYDDAVDRQEAIEGKPETERTESDVEFLEHFARVNELLGLAQERREQTIR